MELSACPSCGWGEGILLPVRPAVVKAGACQVIERPRYTRCGGCSLIYAAIRQSPDELEAYHQAFQESEQRTYTVYPPPPEYLQHQAAYAEALGLIVDRHIDVSDQHVLQLRCECGFHLARLKDRGAEVWGLDYFPSNVQYARENLGVSAGLMTADLASSPGLDRAYDVILSNHLLTHALDLTETLHVMLRVLRPGGTLILHGEPDLTIRIRQRWPKRINNYHKQLFTRESLVAVCRQVGLEADVVHTFKKGLTHAIPAHSMVAIARRRA